MKTFIPSACAILTLAALVFAGGCGQPPVSPDPDRSEAGLPTTSPVPSATGAIEAASPSASSTITPSTTSSSSLLPESEPPAPAEETTEISPDFIPTLVNHFGYMPARWNYEGAGQAGGAWDRPFFELFQWGMIEVEPGVFNFNQTDRQVQQSGNAGLHIIANIQPFAKWDQAVCHGDLPVLNAPVPPDQQSSRGKPCDIEAYRNFVTRLVERYDGDGVDDMPGLTFPVKHWEVMNEPEFQDMYFQGTPAEYVEVLRVTHDAAKAADPEATIVQGGMAGMMPESEAFWQGVFDSGGGQYLDIMNMHSIGHGEHLNIPAFKQLLARNGLEDKPFWITEVQYQQSHQTVNYDNEDFAKILARSYIFALANGADKLFYVNIQMPPGWDDGKMNFPFGPESALFIGKGEPTAMFLAHRTVADLLGGLSATDTVEILSERVGDWHVEEGQYRFVMDGKTVYALFGSGGLPAEITGEITVIGINGVETVADAATVSLTDSPIFIAVE